MSAVPALDVGTMARRVRGRGAESLIAGMAAEIETYLAAPDRFGMTPRVATPPREGFIEPTPASDGQPYELPDVNGPLLDPSRGRQTVTAFGVLAEDRDSCPTLFCEMTLPAAWRIAATSAMPARWLTRVMLR